MASFNNEWLDEPEEPGKALPFPNERCPKCEGLGWGFKRWEDETYISTQYEFYCPECGYNIVGDLGEPLWEGHLKSPTVLNSITEGATLAQEPVLPYLSRPRIPIISSITETDGQGESILTYRDDSEEPIGYLSYHLDRINKTVGVNSVWAHPDKRREGIASALLKELRQKYQDWKIDVSWTTDDGTAWAQANDELIDLGDYKLGNSWDDTRNTDQLKLNICPGCSNTEELVHVPAQNIDGTNWYEQLMCPKCNTAVIYNPRISNPLINRGFIDAVHKAHSNELISDDEWNGAQDSWLKYQDTWLDKYLSKTANDWDDEPDNNQPSMEFCPQCGNAEDLLSVADPVAHLSGMPPQIICPACDTWTTMTRSSGPEVFQGMTFSDGVEWLRDNSFISDDEYQKAYVLALKKKLESGEISEEEYQQSAEHLAEEIGFFFEAKTADAWDTHPNFDQKRLFRNCLVEGCTDPAPDYGPALCESCLAHRNSYERGGGRGNRANNKKQVDDWLTRQANAWDDVDDNANTQQVINLCPRCGSRCAIDRGYSCNKCSDEKYFACFNCLKEFTCPYTDHEWERNIVPVDYLGWAKLFNLQQIPLPESLANSGDPRLEGIWRSYERQRRQASALWDDADDPGQFPFPNSTCPTCGEPAYEFEESAGQQIVYCANCWTSNTVWKSQYENEIESDHLALGDLKFGLEHWPLKSGSWDDDGYANESQFMLEACPKCGSSQVLAFPETDDNWQGWLCFDCNQWHIMEMEGIYRDPDDNLKYLQSHPIELGIEEYGIPANEIAKFYKASNWGEEVQEGQTFMPVDKEWMDKNIPLWAYYCPECSSENVRMGPASSNDYQIPDWEDIDLVNEIEKLHSENPEKDIDYCPDCNSVWIQPELDYVVHKQKKGAADPEWWSEFVKNTPYMLHFFVNNEEPFDAFYSITNDGLIPYMAPLHNAPSSNWEGSDLEPRAGHVYLMHPAYYNRVDDWDPKYNAVAIVDIRFLDPSRVNPDEDWFRSHFEDDPYNSEEYGSSGAWANSIDLRDPDQVRTSMEQGSIAYKGSIPPEAIVDIVDKEDLGVLLRSIQNPSPREYPSDLAHYAPFFEQSLKQAGNYEDARELLYGGGGWEGMPEPDKDAMAKYWRGRNSSWTKGEWGKGVVYDNGEVATWNVSKDGYPHHSHAGDYKFSIWISPDGYFTSAGWINTNGSFGVEEFFDESDLEPLAELGFKYMDPWDWVMEYWGQNETGGYGHAQNILDILNKQGGYEIQF